MGKLAVVSLGCAKNLVDTEIMLGQLLGNGWELTTDLKAAELILVNTCGFIGPAKTESINQVLELAEYKRPGRGNCRQLVVAGCLVQRYAAELAAALPEVDRWLGLGEIGTIASLVGPERAPGPAVIDLPPFLNDQNLPRHRATLAHTAYVKIAEGCSHCCSYCAIPLIKGEFRSRRLAAIITEVKSLVQTGAQEINLIAQDITMYGRDLTPPASLTTLLKTLIAEAAPPWIRLLYAYPSGIDQPLLELMATTPTICRYLDLPLQHINGRILKLMNRLESPHLLQERLALIRRLVPGIVLRTTLIAGFPSETKAEFQELLEFVATARFEHLGVFGYSREEGTPAFTIKPQLSAAVKTIRCQQLLAAQQQNSARWLAGLVGSEVEVLVDRLLPDGQAVGRSQHFAPESDGVIYLTDYQGSAGRFVRVRVERSDTYNLYARVLK